MKPFYREVHFFNVIVGGPSWKPMSVRHVAIRVQCDHVNATDQVPAFHSAQYYFMIYTIFRITSITTDKDI